MSNTALSAKSSANPALDSAIKKAAKHLMPMLVILYFVAFLDRTNVGFAEDALQMDRGISAGAFALGAGIFFIGYAIFEIPSNLLLKKFGARFWLARIAITWGIVAAAFAFVTDGIDAALEQARAAAGDKNVIVMGGADVLRQYLATGVVDELTLTISPVLLGGGTRLFDGIERTDIAFERTAVVESPYATHVRYEVRV